MGRFRDIINLARYGSVEGKAVWSIDSGPPGASDRNNFTTNRITVAEYADSGAAGGAAAIGYSATWACVNLIAGTAASLTPSVLQKQGGVMIERNDHPLWWLLRADPNAEQDDFEFWEFMFASVELHGNAFAPIDRRTGGAIVALTPVPPQAMQVSRDRQGLRRYRWTVDGEQNEVGEADMLHIRGFGGGPLGGASTLSVCRRAFAGAVAADAAAKALFDNGARPSGILSTDARLTGDQRNSLEGKLQEKFVGSINAGRPMLLDGGVKWETLTIDPVDAQMLESRKFSGEEICRIFGVPPAMVGYGDKASNWGTGKEVDVLGFIKFALRKRLRRFERALTKQLLTRVERQQGLKIEFGLEGLLRGDSQARAEFYQVMVRLGLMTRNEARALENLPPIPGGDVAMVQMQDVPLTDAIAAGGAAANGGVSA